MSSNSLRNFKWQLNYSLLLWYNFTICNYLIFKSFQAKQYGRSYFDFDALLLFEVSSMYRIGIWHCLRNPWRNLLNGVKFCSLNACNCQFSRDLFSIKTWIISCYICQKYARLLWKLPIDYLPANSYQT